tara:strand:+ start:3286 stop:4137 length:852 start_codon:yes stop_codon:yes gene_type:complete
MPRNEQPELWDWPRRKIPKPHERYDPPPSAEELAQLTRVHIALVGCGKKKALIPMPAKELYTSSQFQSTRRYVESTFDHWWILSARHRVLEPEEEIEPYDQKLDPKRAQQWANSVTYDLAAHRIADPRSLDLRQRTWGEHISIAILASKLYTNVVEEALRGRGFRGEINIEFSRLDLYQRNALIGRLNNQPGEAKTTLPKPQFGLSDVRRSSPYRDPFTGRIENTNDPTWSVGAVEIRSSSFASGRSYRLDDHRGYRKTFYDRLEAKRDAVRQANQLARKQLD